MSCLFAIQNGILCVYKESILSQKSKKTAIDQSSKCPCADSNSQNDAMVNPLNLNSYLATSIGSNTSETSCNDKKEPSLTLIWMNIPHLILNLMQMMLCFIKNYRYYVPYCKISCFTKC